MDPQIQTPSKLNFARIFEYCLLALVALVPVAFYPSILVSLYSSKIALVTILVVGFLAVFLAYILSRGLIQLPKSKILIPIGMFPLIALAAALFSGSVQKSLVGSTFDYGSAGSFILLTLLFFVAILTFQDEAKVKVKTVFALFASACLVILHLILRMFASFLPAALASRIPNFLAGSSVDTSILLGVSIIAALMTLNALNMSRRLKIGFYIFIVAAMTFVGAAGFMPVIIALGVFSLVYFVYTFAWQASSASMIKNEKTSFLSIFIVGFVLLLILSGGKISGYLANSLHMNTLEVRPNFASTMSLVGQSWKSNAVLGVGPNMFKELWDLHKPADINMTDFWATSFDFGSGFIPTVAATTGVLGAAALVAFLVFFVMAGFRAMFSPNSEFLWRYVSTTTFFVALFLWIMAFFYVPSISIMALAFIFSGIFVSTLAPQQLVKSLSINVFSNPKANFVSVFVIVVLLLFSIAGGYFVFERVVAAGVYQKGANSFAAGDSQNAKASISKALALATNDTFYRTFAESSLNQVGTLLSSVSSPQNISDAQRGAIQAEIADSINATQLAIAWNPKNYENYFMLGRIYEVLGANGITGAYDSAKTNFEKAAQRAPTNPAIPLAFGRIAAFTGNADVARENINKAIELKKNYTDAYYTLAQLEAASNNIQAAIKSVETTTLIDPQNAGLYFQLGLLKYNNKDFAGAARAFLGAVTLVPDYANAKYFLGLSYEKLGKREEAIKQFEEIQKTNPDNQEIGLILANLKAGKSIFADAQPPVDNKPEKRKTPPIQEN